MGFSIGFNGFFEHKKGGLGFILGSVAFWITSQQL
jgi:hypothetical protein